MSIRTPRNTPSLQHLASILDVSSAEKTAKNIISVRDSRLNIQTWRARDYVGLVLAGIQDIEWIKSQALQISNPHLRTAALEILPLSEQLRIEHSIKWFRNIDRQILPFTKSVSIPVNPLGIAGSGKKIYLVWPQVWKTKSLTPSQFNFVCTILERQLIRQDPDLNDLLWAEMSAVNGNERNLQVRTLEAAQFYSDVELLEIANILDSAMTIVANTPANKRSPKQNANPDQGRFEF